MKYDRASNERNAIGALQFMEQSLHWFRLDDGVMGGQSETNHSVVVTTSNNNNEVEGGDGGTASASAAASAAAAVYLDFNGTINTEGGGFCSIRTNFDGGLSRGTNNTKNCIRIKFTGDGKTYKFLLSDGTRGFSTPSWQQDIPTTSSGKEEILDISFDELQASLGPRPAPSHLQLDPATMKEMGFMLSLKLTDGSPNPVETFGDGIFPFSLQIHSIEYIIGDIE
eukprot:CAMPEP_0170870982 /NCGR_PEP_ID=MMETSP0734-20130129/25496_1 /TAXON_ID=186038 /ORGANISM="Fragilariopsis kerguelensis, Strain L26-C5" /LENGTH=224 /DNA_ID=CAMNT_0011250083 /DNA_START=243 /DNA_END=920 /DNA_ORIENTATION=-